MLSALDALSLASAGHHDAAIELIGRMKAANPNPYLSFFDALLEKRGQSADAQDAFIHTLVAQRDAQLTDAFLFEEGPLAQVIRFYAMKGQPRAALLASELDPALKESGEDAEDDETVDSVEEEDVQVEAASSVAKAGPRFQTLRELKVERELRSRVELLELLSGAAEQVGDLSRALEFEKVRRRLLPTGAERQSAEARMGQLLLRLKENSRRAVIVAYSVDQNLITKH
jgi:hypothetical protein